MTHPHRIRLWGSPEGPPPPCAPVQFRAAMPLLAAYWIRSRAALHAGQAIRVAAPLVHSCCTGGRPEHTSMLFHVLPAWSQREDIDRAECAACVHLAAGVHRAALWGIKQRGRQAPSRRFLTRAADDTEDLLRRTSVLALLSLLLSIHYNKEHHRPSSDMIAGAQQSPPLLLLSGCCSNNHPDSSYSAPSRFLLHSCRGGFLLGDRAEPSAEAFVCRPEAARAAANRMAAFPCALRSWPTTHGSQWQ